MFLHWKFTSRLIFYHLVNKRILPHVAKQAMETLQKAQSVRVLRLEGWAVGEGRADCRVHDRIKLWRRPGEADGWHSQVRGEGQTALPSKLESEMDKN